jgi:hypothetical protein
MHDQRDLRDPEVLGQALLDARFNYEGVRWHYDPERNGSRADVPLSILYDREVSRLLIPPYNPSESVVDSTVRAYREQMQKQAAQGDLAATRMLLENGWGLPEHMDQEIADRARTLLGSAPEPVE